MQPAVATVPAYLAALPDDRRAAVEAVREVFLKNLVGYEERILYGMIGYAVPHSTFPAGYHCDPKQPLPFGGIASQKGHMAIHLMGLYMAGERSDLTQWFQDAWLKTGRKLDMGKGCVRFKKLDDLALDVLAGLLQRMPAKTYVALYEAAMQSTRAPKSASSPRRTTSPRSKRGDQ